MKDLGPDGVWVRLAVGEGGHTEPGGALTMNGETEAGHECVSKQRGWRESHWKLSILSEKSPDPSCPGQAGSPWQSPLSFLW